MIKNLLPKRWVLAVFAVLVLTNVASGWLVLHMSEAKGEAVARAEQAEASNQTLRIELDKAEQAAATAAAARQQAEHQRQQALKQLAELERTQPDVKAWSSVPVPSAVLELLQNDNRERARVPAEPLNN